MISTLRRAATERIGAQLFISRVISGIDVLEVEPADGRDLDGHFLVARPDVMRMVGGQEQQESLPPALCLSTCRPSRPCPLPMLPLRTVTDSKTGCACGGTTW